MEKKLSNNLGLKVLSVFLAFFVWLAVMNIANPKVMRSQEVPLEILNGDILESSGKTYEVIGDRDTVTVYYKVTTSDSANIKASDFRAYIDLADVYEPTATSWSPWYQSPVSSGLRPRIYSASPLILRPRQKA